MNSKPLVTAWSFSRYADYILCPFKFKCKHIDKLKEPPNEAMANGIAVHKTIENYLNGASKTLPKTILLKEEIDHVKSFKNKTVEGSWTWTKSWTETTFNDWANAWLRVKIDAAYINLEHNVLVPYDWKTGKFRPEKNAEYLLQLELYALAGLKKYPTIDGVSPRLVYVDQNRVYPDPAQKEEELFYPRKDEARLQKLWERRVIPMFNDTKFKPTPNNMCKWCHYRKSNGGPCEY